MTDKQLVLWMRDRNVDHMTFDFSGGGDSGGFNGYTAYDKDGKVIQDVLDIKPESHEGKVNYILDALGDISEESFFDAVDHYSEMGGDWWNNEGGQGCVRINANASYEVHIGYNEYHGLGEPNEDGEYEEYEAVEESCDDFEGEIDMSEVLDGTPTSTC